MMIIWIS